MCLLHSLPNSNAQLAWRMYGVSFIVGALVIGGMEAQAPGEVLWG